MTTNHKAPARAVARAGLAAVILGTGVLAGCPRPLLETPAERKVTSPPEPQPLASQLGAGDLFEVRVFQEAELSGAFRVGVDGSIDFPFCGRLPVAGLTTGEIGRKLTDCLKGGYLKEPQVTVIAREYNSKRVLVYGHVQKPGVFPYEDRMSVLQALAAAGGFSQFAAKNQTSVIRAGESGEERFRVPVEDIGVGRVPNFYLRPGDVVYVPESWN
jgi:protein involved in polysaccharide export with SLBB domain